MPRSDRPGTPSGREPWASGRHAPQGPAGPWPGFEADDQPESDELAARREKRAVESGADPARHDDPEHGRSAVEDRPAQEGRAVGSGSDHQPAQERRSLEAGPDAARRDRPAQETRAGGTGAEHREPGRELDPTWPADGDQTGERPGPTPGPDETRSWGWSSRKGTGANPAASAARRFRPRSWKGAAGLGIVGAAVLLYVFVALDPQAQWWIPLAGAFVVLVLLSLLRLDRLLKGWTWHVAGLALLAGLVYETSGNPWSWALAVSIGVLVAGALRLPRWPVAAVGVVLFAGSMVGYQFRAADVRQQETQVAQQAGQQMRNAFGYETPQIVVNKLSQGLAPADPQAICRLLDPAAQTAFVQASGAASCENAVTAAAGKVPAGSPTTVPRASSSGPVPPPGTLLTLDACATAWGRATPAVGTVQVVRTDDLSRATWRVANLSPCP